VRRNGECGSFSSLELSNEENFDPDHIVKKIVTTQDRYEDKFWLLHTDLLTFFFNPFALCSFSVVVQRKIPMVPFLHLFPAKLASLQRLMASHPKLQSWVQHL